MATFSYHKENISNLAVDTMLHTESFYELLAEELDSSFEDKTINEYVLFAYHSTAYSTFMSFKVYYLQNIELSHSEFEDFIESFERFSQEFLSNRSINQSMQHTFMYYDDVVKSFNKLADLLQLNHFNLPK